MKKINFISGIAVVALVLGMSLTSCSPKNDPNAGKTDPSTIATANLISHFISVFSSLKLSVDNISKQY